MFDPSKLDLNLENTSEKNENKKAILKAKEEVISEKIISKKIKKEKNLKENDILENLNISEEKKESISETIEKKSVLNNFNNSIIKEKFKNEDNIKTEKEVVVGQTEYEKSIIKTAITEEKKENTKENIIFDINTTSVDIILAILVDKEYDFATFEPSEEAVKITFRKDKVIKEVKYIKYPIYTNILLKAKALTKLTLEETENTQEGTGEKIIRNKNHKITTKVVPGNLGAKLFIKTNEIEKKAIKKDTKKTSISQIFTFLGAITFITLIIGGAFLGFITINAKTIEDVKFFYSLGINLNDINNFMGQVLSTIFSILIFIETIFLVIILFKLSLTKKEYKQKKIRYGIISAILLILTFSTASAWMVIDKKIKSLPNWQEMAYGDVQIYDNAKLLSESFNKEGSLLKDTSNLIGPVQIKFDLSFFMKKEEDKGFKVKKFIWDFGNGEIKETTISTIIYNFKDKGNYPVSLTIEEVDLQGKIINKTVENIPNINISYVVNINEKKLNNGGKLVDFDASNLKELGKVEWYFMDNLKEPIWEGEIFRVGKPIFEETLVGMYIKRNDKKSDKLDKLFIITGEEQANLDGEIVYTRDIIKDLEFTISLKDLKNDFGNGYIEEFKWKIGDKEITKIGDINSPEEASKIIHIFESYGKHKVSVILKDSAGETKEISTTIDIPKKITLLNQLRIFNNNNNLETVKYEKKLNEYYIDEIAIPTIVEFDARFIRATNLNYRLKKVDWDFNSDGDIDKSSKKVSYELNIEGGYKITVYYEFVNKKINSDIIKLKEQIFIEGLKKEAIINFEIKRDGDYVPLIASFDASQSQVKGQNIEKFIWDYGDGEVEERDSIVPGHKYSVSGNYEIKLTVVTSIGKEYSTTKKLILKSKPQDAKIKTSIKVAPIGQEIDFSSDESEGQIIGYFWNFGDGETSTEANPTYSYKKTGTYKVHLTLDFANKNIEKDNISIEIY